MPEQNQNDEPDTAAPTRLVDALRNMPQPVILVPPQFDEAVLSRSRLHLARIVQRQNAAPQPGESHLQDLALAARATESTARPSSFASPGELRPLAQLRPTAGAGRHTRLWAALAVLLAAGLLALIFWGSHNSRSGAIPAFQPRIIQHQ